MNGKAAAASTPLLELTNVSKTFRIPRVRRDTVREHLFGFFDRQRYDHLRALDAVSLRVNPGDSLGIMGRNGCGKSTLLKVLCGIYGADSGNVQLRAGVTPILQLGVGWNPELDAIDNIFLLGTVMGLSLAAVRASLDDILAFAEVERFARLPLKHYSSGMASRLAYAVAFRAVREVLVLDEIFAVGDAGFRARCEQRYRQLHRDGHTIVLVSHDPRVVEQFCSRAVLMDAGRIVDEGTGAEIAARYLQRTRHTDVPPAAPV
jgi:ABC-type polysaccharide/polyol phosphate transport system ATPase subunit